jgi:hypothetical protein
MNKKGQIGQIISSFPVLFLVIFLMLIFVLLSGFFKFTTSNGEEIAKLDETLNSKILLELFLGDYITLDGKEIKVEELIEDYVKVSSGHNGIYYESYKLEAPKNLILDKFDRFYGCDGSNILEIAHVGSNINYPESYGADEFEGGYRKHLETSDPNISPIDYSVYVKENVKC